jgi:hypothetical protein
MQEEWNSLWSTGGKNQNLQEVFHDARRVALTKHITHYGPQEGKIKIYKRGIS